jgi:hypothetical protein
MIEGFRLAGNLMACAGRAPQDQRDFEMELQILMSATP